MSQTATSNSGLSSRISGRCFGHPNWRIAFLLILPTFLSCCAVPQQKPFDLGHWDQKEIEQLQERAKEIAAPGDKVALISEPFLKTPYLANTLIGSAETSEVFTLRLDGVDCFTFLDYVEALRRSVDFEGFKETLRDLRYRNGKVTFLDRNHFFSVWGNTPLAPLRDITAQVGGTNVRWVEKYLNQKGDGTLYLPGYPVKKQVIAFILPATIDQSMLNKLHTGDYVGIYSSLPGLDVSHTGIIIKKDGETYLRHASTRQWRQQVIDEALLPYLDGQKGLIIYRPVAEY